MTLLAPPSTPSRAPLLLAFAPQLGARIDAYADLARQAEQAGFDAIVLPDFVAQEALAEAFDPVMVMAALSAVTERIGLIAIADPSYDQPYNFARRFASADLLSQGRAGWAMRLAPSPAQPLNFSQAGLAPRAERVARASEFVHVVKGLWNSWEAGALAPDVAAGRYFDPAKLHVLGHKGDYFTVRGPLNTPRAPQGWPVIAYLDPAEDELALAAGAADLVCARPASLEAAQGLARALATSAPAAPPRLLCDLERVVGAPLAEAEPAAAADRITAWLAAGAADGLTLDASPGALAAFAERLAPALLDRGLIGAEPAGGLLRQRLDLTPAQVSPQAAE